MSVNSYVPVITIDGPGGTGKGTISKMLSEKLNWHYLDSGAIYRVLGLDAVKKGVALDDEKSLEQLARTLPLTFKVLPETTLVFLDNLDVSSAIRTEQSGQNASKVASNAAVRAALLQRQRDFAEPPGLVTDGRDMGTVVFPDACLKIFLNATQEERAKRRYLQLQAEGNHVSLPQVLSELSLRDKRDEARATAPLKPANDAIIIDTTGLSVDQVYQHVLQLAIKCTKVLNC